MEELFESRKQMKTKTKQHSTFRENNWGTLERKGRVKFTENLFSAFKGTIFSGSYKTKHRTVWPK